MRHDPSLRRDVRGNALWGRRGESRANALWGSGKRGIVITALAAMLVVPVAGSAAPKVPANALVPQSLLSDAAQHPQQLFDVIVQGDSGSKAAQDDVQNSGGKFKKQFLTVSGVSASLPGSVILKLAKYPHVTAITPDAQVQSTGYEDATMWQSSADLSILQNSFDPTTGAVTGPAPQAPAIAIVDSGVQYRSDFGTRLLMRVDLCSLCTTSGGDDLQGHGTMVANIAAGSGRYPGAAPNARIISIRTANQNGESRMSDVIAAADWIRQNAAKYNIRVANFSLAGATQTSFRVDPLDRSVESLWLNGVVVVAAAGNHGSDSGPVSMSYAPGNDPFVITVGAVDQHMTADPNDDTIPSWSAYGTTMDGFHKPDIAAPGRYMVSAVPATATMPTTFPDRVVASGYMWMSGTSFAAPVVAGAAAQILARHPTFTPDQVKGALMLTAHPLPSDMALAGGVGELDAGLASTLGTPPNPNDGLQQFVKTSLLTGGRSLDAASWNQYVQTHASWAQASWNAASWASASWNAASWGAASWNAASWNASVDTLMTTLASYSESSDAP